MIFSDQELTGLENLMSNAGKKGEKLHEKQADFSFQKNSLNHQFFLELQAKGNEKSSAPVTKQPELLIHQKLSEKDYLDLFIPEQGQLLLPTTMTGSENRSCVSGSASTEIYSPLASMVEIVERYNMVKPPLKGIPIEEGSVNKDLSAVNIHKSILSKGNSTKYTKTAFGKDSKQLEKFVLIQLTDRLSTDLNPDLHNTGRSALNLSMLKSQETLLKDNSFMEYTKTDDVLRMVINPEGKIKNALETPKASTLNKSNFINPERGQSTPGFSSQIQAATDMLESINNGNSLIKQAETAFDKNMQRTENNVLGQIAARLFSGVRQNIPNMTIHLYPPELGKVKVKIISKKDGLNVHLHSTNNQVAGILGKNLPLLQQSLEDQGIALSDLRVSVESDNQEKSRFEEKKFLMSDENAAPKKVSPDDLNVPLSHHNHGGWKTTQGLSLRV